MWTCVYISDIIVLIVDKSGQVCISILHEPGEDQWGYERPEERWVPIHTVETIMMSVISMLADPNDESPANIDAAVSTGFKLYQLRLKFSHFGKTLFSVRYCFSSFCISFLCLHPQEFSNSNQIWDWTFLEPWHTT